jgi:uncharacterized protein (DUF885 family)
MRLLISVLISIFMGNFLLAAGPAADLDARRKALNDLLDEHWEYRLRESPIFASFVGDKRYNDKVDDFSQEAIDAHLEQQRRFLTRFEAIDTTGFPDQEVLNKRLIVRDLKMELDEARFKLWEMPVDQQSGPHIELPQLINILPFDTLKDYEDYIARLKLYPRLFDQTIVQMRKGMADGLMPPRMLLEKVNRMRSAPLSPTNRLTSIFLTSSRILFPKPIASICAKPPLQSSAIPLIRLTQSWPLSSAMSMRPKAAPSRASGLCQMVRKFTHFA